MKIISFIKRLNNSELGKGGMNDFYIAIPSEVDLSGELKNGIALNIFDRVQNIELSSNDYNIRFVSTNQNNQDRISGLGEYFKKVNAKAGDEILIQKIEDNGDIRYFIDFKHRNVIVFQKDKRYIEILTTDIIKKYKKGNDYIIKVNYKGRLKELNIKFIKNEKKKKTSRQQSAFFDLIIDNESILNDYKYLEYIEILVDSMRMDRMKTWIYSINEWGK